MWWEMSKPAPHRKDSCPAPQPTSGRATHGLQGAVRRCCRPGTLALDRRLPGADRPPVVRTRDASFREGEITGCRLREPDFSQVREPLRTEPCPPSATGADGRPAPSPTYLSAVRLERPSASHIERHAVEASAKGA